MKLFAIVTVLAYLAALIAAAIGWVLNIVAICHEIGGPITAMFVARLVGVPVVVLGAVLGWF